MLVIRRRSGESFLIGDDIEVEILDIEGSQVKLGIRAPKSIPVWREEIHRSTQANRAAAAILPAEALAAVLNLVQQTPPQKTVHTRAPDADMQQ